MPSVFEGLDTGFQPLKYIPQYQGLPLESFSRTSDVLQSRYDKAIQDQDSLELAIASMDLDPRYEGERQRALQEARSTLDWVANNRGAWENAQPYVRQAAKRFAGDYNVKQALQQTKTIQEEQDLIHKMQAQGHTPVVFESVANSPVQYDDQGRIVRKNYRIEERLNHEGQKKELVNMLQADFGDIFRIEGGKRLISKAKLDEINKKRGTNFTEEDVNSITLLADGKWQALSPNKLNRLENELLRAYKGTAEYRQEKEMREKGVLYNQSEDPDEDIKNSLKDFGMLRTFYGEDIRRNVVGDGLDRLLGSGKNTGTSPSFETSMTTDNKNRVTLPEIEFGQKGDKLASGQSFNTTFEKNKKGIAQTMKGLESINPFINIGNKLGIGTLMNDIQAFVLTMFSEKEKKELSPVEQAQFNYAQHQANKIDKGINSNNPDEQLNIINEFVAEKNKLNNPSVAVSTQDLTDPDVKKSVDAFNNRTFKTTGSGKDSYVYPTSVGSNLYMYDANSPDKKESIADSFSKGDYKEAKAVNIDNKVDWYNPFGFPEAYQVTIVKKNGDKDTRVISGDERYMRDARLKFLNTASQADFNPSTGVSWEEYVLPGMKEKTIFSYQPLADGTLGLTMFVGNRNLADEGVLATQEEAAKAGVRIQELLLMKYNEFATRQE